ncbi:hypothetical protein [Helicobacter rodentium]|uniref:hypothetical protein n=1 Tax=Helicobacter rodentium TaxID=59617 RepID=UPI0012EC3D50|nr:hypothetical protein [Helicobacter rodentium]
MQFLIIDCHANFLNFLAMTQWLAFCHCEAVRSTTKQSIILLPQKDSIANTFICVIMDLH